MNASLLAVLNDAERLLVAQTEPAELATLDEDAAIEFEGRIRRVRNKHVGQYRRAASARVAEEGGRAKARPGEQAGPDEGRGAPGHRPRRGRSPAGEARQPISPDRDQPRGPAPHMRGSIEARSRWAPRFFGEASGSGA